MKGWHSPAQSGFTSRLSMDGFAVVLLQAGRNGHVSTLQFTIQCMPKIKLEDIADDKTVDRDCMSDLLVGPQSAPTVCSVSPSVARSPSYIHNICVHESQE